MTKRLTLVGFAAVAVLWGPYVYAELARRPVKPPPNEPEPFAVQPVVVPTPVAYKPSSLPEPLDLEPAAQTALGTSIDPDRLPAEPADELAAEPAIAEPELGEPPIDPNALPPSAATPESAPAAPEETAQAAPAAAPAPPQPSAAAPAAPAEAPAAAAEPAAPAAEPEAKPEGEGAQESTEKSAAAELGAPPQTTKERNLNVIPDAIAPAFRSAFAKETRDVIWAAKEEPRLTSFLSGAGVPSNAITEVRCQRTVCRVAINATLIDPPAQTQLYERAQQEFGAGLALDPTQDQGAAFYVLRRAQ